MELVLDKTNMSTPYYKLERPLNPGTKYFWCVRAKFEKNGHTQVTPWSAIDRGGRRLAVSPNYHSYKFETSGDSLDDDTKSFMRAAKLSAVVYQPPEIIIAPSV
jgi:hypothetical protein